MPNQAQPKSDKPTQEEETVVWLTVAGFKSIREEQSIELRPLTILAGANSAGKSSIMQPFLLLKQTLEADYDPGPLLLTGPNVRFTSADQLLSRTGEGDRVSPFRAGMRLENGDGVELRFLWQLGQGLSIAEMSATVEERTMSFKLDMPPGTIEKLLRDATRQEIEQWANFAKGDRTWRIIRERCFLKPALSATFPQSGLHDPEFAVGLSPVVLFGVWLRGLIHLPPLRGNPQRTYSVAAVGRNFPGEFGNYVASVLARWQREDDKTALNGVCADLRSLGLSWTVSAEALNDAEVEIHVSRLPNANGGGSRDLVSIADVGFGVSQVLPVVVALHAAKEGQPVYIEQPEIHLHPRAQVALAEVLANAAKRGGQIIVETHSRTLLVAIQTLVAKGELSTELVKLHWFTRDPKSGTTTIQSRRPR